MDKLDIQKLSEILDGIRYPVLIDVSDCVHWHYDNEVIHWVTKGDKSEEGYSYYSGELPEGYTRQDGYFIANIDTCTGCWVTTVFSETNELTYSDFFDKYEDWI